MASLDEIAARAVEAVERAKPMVEGAIATGSEKAVEAIEQAKPVVESAIATGSEKAEKAVERAKPVVEGAIATGSEKATEFAEKVSGWANSEHPEAEKAFETVTSAADEAIDKIATSANSAYERIRDKAEEALGKDLDGDGKIGKTSQAYEEAKADVAVAIESVADAAEKIAERHLSE